MTASLAPTEGSRTDGRAERRERNRASVVEALLDLYREGQLAPSAELIARRAGVSPRSLFRYFDDVDALVREAVAQQQERLAPRLATAVDPALDLDARVQTLVARRLDLYEAMGHVARVARAVAHQQPVVAGELDRIRSVLRDHLGRTFAPELEAKPAPDRDHALAAADVLCSWEAVDLLRSDHGLSREGAAAVLEAGLRSVLR